MAPTRLAEKPVVGASPPLEWVGEGPETWAIHARLFPHRFGGLGDLKKLGSLGARTLFFFVLTSVLSAVLGITALHLLQPGAGFDPQTLAEMQAKYAGDVQSLASKASANAPTDLLGRVNQILDMFLPRNLLKPSPSGG